MSGGLRADNRVGENTPFMNRCSAGEPKRLGKGIDQHRVPFRFAHDIRSIDDGRVAGDAGRRGNLQDFAMHLAIVGLHADEMRFDDDRAMPLYNAGPDRPIKQRRTDVQSFKNSWANAQRIGGLNHRGERENHTRPTTWQRADGSTRSRPNAIA